ncbi:MAG: hydrogenase maturation protease [Chloroflexaceae bacterium]|nr:hydrogenase maturation protease [Chloroflexaceae bacterium]
MIIGVGNAFRGDDAVGLIVAQHIREHAPNLAVYESSGEGAALMSLWQQAETVLLIDAVSSKSEPGTIHCLDASNQPLPTSWRCFSTHAFGVAEAIELARTLGQLPRQLTVYGIEGGQFALQPGLSPAVEQAVPLVVQRILHDVTSQGTAA